MDSGKRVRALVVCILLALPALLAPPACAAQSAELPNKKGALDLALGRVKKLVEVIDRPDAPVTMADLKLLLPRRAFISQPIWMEGDEATGNVAEISGSIVGQVVFLNAEQRRALAAGQELDGSQQFRDTDPVAYIQIYVGDIVKGRVTRLEDRLKELVNRLVRPSRVETPDTVAPPTEMTEVNGWVATWRFGNGRSIDLWHRWYGHKYVLNIYFTHD